MSIAFQRVWAMPSSDTFSIPEIGGFVRKHLLKACISVDPFARNKRWATFANDLNPQTAAEFHMEAVEFLNMLAARGVKADLLLFDPPYSPRQVKECYAAIGKKMQMEDGQNARLMKLWRQAALPILTADATILSFGWNSSGFGFDITEILLVCHGSAHNDTICLAERRTMPPQLSLSTPASVPAEPEAPQSNQQTT